VIPDRLSCQLVPELCSHRLWAYKYVIIPCTVEGEGLLSQSTRYPQERGSLLGAGAHESQSLRRFKGKLNSPCIPHCQQTFSHQLGVKKWGWRKPQVRIGLP